MRRLEGAVRSGDADKIKDEAQETVTLLTEFLSERGARHEAQITEMAARLQGLRDELDSVRKQAAVDSLTQIYNRSAFDEQIEREIDLATLFGKRGCLLMIDIDHFKWVNDTHGHPCGDAVLREVAQTLKRCFMRRDDFVARYGGEEFAIVLRDITLPVARDVSERGMAGIRNLEIPYPGLEEPLRITISMGIARLRRARPPAPGSSAPIGPSTRRRTRAGIASRSTRSISTRPDSSTGTSSAPGPLGLLPLGACSIPGLESAGIARTRLASRRSPPYSSAPPKPISL